MSDVVDDTNAPAPAPLRTGRPAKRATGCIVKSSLLAAVALGAGVYLMGRWETVNGAGRAGAVVLVLFGALLLIPLLFFVLAKVGKIYFNRKVMKPLEGMLDPARRMVEQNKNIYGDLHERRPAIEEDFDNLDRDWYDRSTAELTALGFRVLGDNVNLTIAKLGVLTVIRVLVSADGTTLAGLFHFNAKQKSILSVDLETEFTDGTFLTATSTGDANLATAPPQIQRRKHPPETSITELVNLHEAEKLSILAAKPEAACVVVSTLQEANEFQDRQQLVKNAFRKGIGYLDPEEVRRIAKRKFPEDEASVAVVTAAADIARRQEHMKSQTDDQS